MNKLCEQNEDFAKFLRDVRIDFDSGVVHKGEYDPIPEDPLDYVAKKLRVRPV